MDRRELTKRLDRLCQTCARYDGAKRRGSKWFNTCVTCGKKLPIEKLQGGHFIPRACYPFRWNDRNVHPQCISCNYYKNGAYVEYSQWFIKEYGEGSFNSYVDMYKSWQQGKLPALKIAEIREAYNYWLAKGRKLEQKTGPLFPKSWKPEPGGCIDYIKVSPSGQHDDTSGCPN